MKTELERNIGAQVWDTWIAMHRLNLFIIGRIIFAIPVLLIVGVLFLLKSSALVPMLVFVIIYSSFIHLLLDRGMAMVVKRVLSASGRNCSAVLEITEDLLVVDVSAEGAGSYDDSFSCSLVDSSYSIYMCNFMSMEFLTIFDRGERHNISFEIGTIPAEFKEVLTARLGGGSSEKGFKFSENLLLRLNNS